MKSKESACEIITSFLNVEALNYSIERTIAGWTKNKEIRDMARKDILVSEVFIGIHEIVCNGAKLSGKNFFPPETKVCDAAVAYIPIADKYDRLAKVLPTFPIPKADSAKAASVARKLAKEKSKLDKEIASFSAKNCTFLT